MKTEPETGSESTTAERLRVEFDQFFGAPPRDEASAFEDLIAVRVAGSPYAIRLCDIEGLHADRKIVWVPSQAPELLGIIGLGHAIAPIYDLRRLLGAPGGPPPRWLALVRAPQPLGLAFDGFERILRLPRTALCWTADGTLGNHLRGVVHADVARPVIDMASLLHTLGRRPRSSSAPKES